MKTEDKEIDIQTTADFLRWLDTGRELAIETLTAAGIHKAQEWSKLGAFAGSTISSPKQPPVYVNLEIEAAFDLLRLTDRIKGRVAGEIKFELFELVLDGVLLNDFRHKIYRSRWQKADHGAAQSSNAKKPRSLTAALADQLRDQHNWRDHLPNRADAHETIGHLQVTYKGQGRYVIQDQKAGKTSKPVLLESIAKKIRT